jgi:D-glycero-D-manno-heptose 1,7-bisphosphate phosphatase
MAHELQSQGVLSNEAKVFRKAVFLDRDGVLNEVAMGSGKPRSPSSLKEFRIVPHAREALLRLKAAGYLLILITNQPEVARGTQQRDFVEDLHRRLRTSLELNDVRVCFHDDEHRCQCRKPEPGLLLLAAKDWNIQMSKSYMIGDRWKDVEAGRRAGCRTVLLHRPYNTQDDAAGGHCALSFESAVEWVLMDGARRSEEPTMGRSSA